jgi:Ca2+-binding RTX toxin-like protein
VNDNPVVLSDSNATANTVAENAANGTVVGITALGTDADTGATVTYSLTDTAGGRFAINSSTGVITVANGTLLDYEAATSHNVTVLATSSDGSTTNQVFAIAITNVNEAPVATANTFTGNEDAGFITVTLAGTDAEDGTAVTLKVSSLPTVAQGVLYLADGVTAVTTAMNLTSAQAASLKFVPALNFNGQFDIPFTATDSNTVTSAPANAHVVVTAVNDAPIANDDPVGNMTISVGLLSQYFGYNEGPDGGNLTSIAQINAFINGRTPDATFVATTFDYGSDAAFANNLGNGTNLQSFLGVDAASLSTDPGTTSDAIIRMYGAVELAAGTYNFQIRGDDGYQVKVDGQVVALVDYIQSPTGTVHTQFTLASGGLHTIEILYWDQGGQAVFKVELSDNNGVSYNLLSSTPVTYNAVHSLNEDTPWAVPVATLLSNDTDVEGNTLTITSVQDAVNGTVSLVGGVVTFTPTLNYSGIASYTYTVSDGNGGTDIGKVNIDVLPVNDLAVVSNVSANATSITFTASDVDSGTTLGLSSPFAAAFGSPAVNNGSATTLTVTEQAAVVTGTLRVTDATAATDVIGLSLGSSAANTFNSSANTTTTALYGFGGDDTLTGGSANDVLVGGTGNDTLTGGAGVDTFNVASGTDTITDLGTGGADTLIVAAGAIANATLGAAYTATAATSNAGTANLSSNALAVDLSLAAGTVGYSVTNTGAATTFTGSAFADSLTGGAGADTLNAGAGNDTLSGGLGNDSLTGGAGIDTFNITSGTDTITDLGVGGSDVLAVSAGATATVTVGAAFTATAATTNSGTANLTTAGFGVNLNLATGTTGYTLTNTGAAATLVGSGFADVLTGGAGADTLTGGAGIDTFNITSGTDTITDLGVGGSDILAVSAGATATATVGAAFTATAATTNSGTANLTTAGFGVNLNLATGTAGYTLTNTGAAATLVGSGFADVLTGGNGADTLNAGAGNDTISGGLGNDALTGGAGVDTFNVTSGTDTISDLGVGGSDILSVSAGATATATVGAAFVATAATTNSGTATLSSAGLAVDMSLATGSTGYTVTNTGVAASFIGSSFADSLTGGTGADTLRGGAGNDTLVGAGGNDTYIFGLTDGTDSINDSAGADAITISAAGAALTGLDFSDSSTTAATGNMTITINGQAITVLNHFTAATTVESLTFTGGASYKGFALGSAAYTLSNDDNGARTSSAGVNTILTGDTVANTLTGNTGNDLLFGGFGNDTLNGGTGADLLVGGRDNDSLTGGAGIDTFYVDIGTDTITDLGTGGADILVVDSGATANATVTAAFVATAATSNSGTATLASSGFGVDLSLVTGTTGYTVTNSGTAATFVGSSFNDTLTGGTGNDILRGGAGADTLSGGNGTDTLTGGAGNDSLTGGVGADTFVWNFGDKGTTAAPAGDTVAGFTTGATGDILNLQDLLQGENSATLTNYLHFTSDGTNTTVSISSAGSFNGSNYGTVTDQTILLNGVNLTGGDAAIITALKLTNNLITD